MVHLHETFNFLGGGGVEGNEISYTESCFWKICSSCGLVCASTTASPLHSRTSVPSCHLSTCQRKSCETTLGLMPFLSRERTFHLLYTQWSLPTLLPLCLPSHKNLLRGWDQTQWGQTPPLLYAGNGVWPLASCLTFLKLNFLLFHTGMIPPYGVVERATMTVKHLLQGRESLIVFLLFLTSILVPCECRRGRRTTPGIRASLSDALWRDKAGGQTRGEVLVIHGLWECVNEHVLWKVVWHF